MGTLQEVSRIDWRLVKTMLNPTHWTAWRVLECMVLRVLLHLVDKRDRKRRMTTEEASIDRAVEVALWSGASLPEGVIDLDWERGSRRPARQWCDHGEVCELFELPFPGSKEPLTTV